MKIARSVAPFYDFAAKIGIDPQLVIDRLSTGGWAECDGKTVTITSGDDVIAGTVPFGYGRYAARWASDFNARVRQYARERAWDSRGATDPRTSPVLR